MNMHAFRIFCIYNLHKQLDDQSENVKKIKKKKVLFRFFVTKLYNYKICTDKLN